MAESSVKVNIGFTSDTSGIKEAQNEWSHLKREMFDLKTAFNFEFMRAGIAIVGQLPGQFKDFIMEGVRFNATLQQSRVAIAGIIAEASPHKFKTVTDALGAAADVMKVLEERATALGLSQEALTQTFATTAGMATKMGISMKDHAELVSIMAAANRMMGQSDMQMLQEIRAIMSGNVNTPAAALAKRYKIDSDKLKKAIAEGNVAEYLKKQFAGVEAVADASSGNIQNQFAKLESSWKKLAGRFAEAIGTELGKGAGGLAEVLDNIPDEKIQEISEAIADVVSSLAELAKVVANNLPLLIKLGQLLIAIGVSTKAMGFVGMGQDAAKAATEINKVVTAGQKVVALAKSGNGVGAAKAASGGFAAMSQQWTKADTKPNQPYNYIQNSGQMKKVAEEAKELADAQKAAGFALSAGKAVLSIGIAVLASEAITTLMELTKVLIQANDARKDFDSKPQKQSEKAADNILSYAEKVARGKQGIIYQTYNKDGTLGKELTGKDANFAQARDWTNNANGVDKKIAEEEARLSKIYKNRDPKTFKDDSPWLKAMYDEADAYRAAAALLVESEDEIWGLFEDQWKAADAIGKRRKIQTDLELEAADAAIVAKKKYEEEFRKWAEEQNESAVLKRYREISDQMEVLNLLIGDSTQSEEERGKLVEKYNILLSQRETYEKKADAYTKTRMEVMDAAVNAANRESAAQERISGQMREQIDLLKSKRDEQKNLEKTLGGYQKTQSVAADDYGILKSQLKGDKRGEYLAVIRKEMRDLYDQSSGMGLDVKQADKYVMEMMKLKTMSRQQSGEYIASDWTMPKQKSGQIDYNKVRESLDIKTEDFGGEKKTEQQIEKLKQEIASGESKLAALKSEYQNVEVSLTRAVSDSMSMIDRAQELGIKVNNSIINGLNDISIKQSELARELESMDAKLKDIRKR